MAGQPADLYVSPCSWTRARVNTTRPSLAYTMTLGARVPDYEVERRLWLNEHYEGGYLFHDSAIVEIVPPDDGQGEWTVKYDWQSDSPGKATKPVAARPTADEKLEFVIPFDNEGKRPGVRGRLRFLASEWNTWNP